MLNIYFMLRMAKTMFDVDLLSFLPSNAFLVWIMKCKLYFRLFSLNDHELVENPYNSEIKIAV